MTVVWSTLCLPKESYMDNNCLQSDSSPTNWFCNTHFIVLTMECDVPSADMDTKLNYRITPLRTTPLKIKQLSTAVYYLNFVDFKIANKMNKLVVYAYI